MTEKMRLRLRRVADGVWLDSNSRLLFFSNADWSELQHMITDFQVTGVMTMQNYVDLPTRTPLHANRPLKPTADDLI